MKSINWKWFAISKLKFCFVAFPSLKASEILLLLPQSSRPPEEAPLIPRRREVSSRFEETRRAWRFRLIFQQARKAVLGNSGSASAQGGIEKFWKQVVDRSALHPPKPLSPPSYTTGDWMWHKWDWNSRSFVTETPRQQINVIFKAGADVGELLLVVSHKSRKHPNRYPDQCLCLCTCVNVFLSLPFPKL